VLALVVWALFGVAVLMAILPVPTTTADNGNNIAVLAGITSGGSGITGLATYPDGTPHPGVYPVDMSAGGGNPYTYVQIDYLPSDVDGGYTFSYRDDSGCAAYNPSSGYYNGRRVRTFVYHYRDNTLLDVHGESYLHLDPDYSYVGVDYADGVWARWNNATAGSPMWPGYAEHFKLNNGTSGRFIIGTIASPELPGAATINCSTGEHLHQEGDPTKGSYAPGLSFYQSTTNRVTDIHYADLDSITGTAP
jgi:hypothetical protein